VDLLYPERARRQLLQRGLRRDRRIKPSAQTARSRIAIWRSWKGAVSGPGSIVSMANASPTSGSIARYLQCKTRARRPLACDRPGTTEAFELCCDISPVFAIDWSSQLAVPAIRVGRHDGCRSFRFASGAAAACRRLQDRREPISPGV